MVDLIKFSVSTKVQYQNRYFFSQGEDSFVQKIAQILDMYVVIPF